MAVDGDERVMATAQQILKSLGTTNSETKDMILILSNFDNRLATITDLIPGTAPLEFAEQILARWDPPTPSATGPPPLPWEQCPQDVVDYLSAVDDVIRLTGTLAISNASAVTDVPDPAFNRAESLLQVAMARLEEEFRLLLVRNAVTLNVPQLYGSIRKASFVSADADFSTPLEDDERDEETPRFTNRTRPLSASEFCAVELIRPESISDLREIADRMIRAGYEKELCQSYSTVRREALEDGVSVLGIDRVSIEEVQKIEWSSLDDKMKKWIQALKIVVRVLLAGEKRLCDQIFKDSHPITEICFTETAKGCLMQVLNFAEAIAISRRSSEKLFRILDMYDVLSSLIADLCDLFSDASGDLICREAKSILSALGDAAKGTFAEFENAVQRETSRRPVQGGEIHPLTRYVMNYVRLLVDYSDTLNLLLGELSPGDGAARPDDDASCLTEASSVGRRLVLLISHLELNLEEKSKLYDDPAIQYIFLMNNILYVVKKVKDSELRQVLGDHWVRKRRGQVRQYATSYFRASWSKVLSCLRDEGLGGGGCSSNVSKVALKDRFKNFNVGFEEIYRTQTAWKVQDTQLREELRLSISDKVIPAYRSFVGRFRSHLEGSRHAGKYMKYTSEDLENFLQDLFEGAPRLLHHPKRKISA